MIVVTGGGIAQEGGGPVLQQRHEFLDVLVGGDVHGGRDAAIDPVLDADVLHPPAGIHNGFQLPDHIIFLMTDLDLPCAGVPLAHEIAPAGGDDLRRLGPDDGDVLHDDLAADVKLGGQLTGGNRFRLPLQNAKDLLPAIDYVQRKNSFHSAHSARRFFMEMSKMGAEWVRAPLEM